MENISHLIAWFNLSNASTASWTWETLPFQEAWVCTLDWRGGLCLGDLRCIDTSFSAWDQSLDKIWSWNSQEPSPAVFENWCCSPTCGHGTDSWIHYTSSEEVYLTKWGMPICILTWWVRWSLTWHPESNLSAGPYQTPLIPDHWYHNEWLLPGEDCLLHLHNFQRSLLANG